jgi:hypothetical protein
MSVMFRLNELTRQTALSGIRRRHPEYSEAQSLMALRRLMFGDELTRAAWPRHPLLDP